MDSDEATDELRQLVLALDSPGSSDGHTSCYDPSAQKVPIRKDKVARTRYGRKRTNAPGTEHYSLVAAG
jgi:hypothetical protein